MGYYIPRDYFCIIRLTMKKISFPSISKKEFITRLKKRKYEDVSVVRDIENYLMKRRGYVFRMPPPGTPVIMLVSGGIESTILWGLLMATYRLHVYPLFLRRGLIRSKHERRAVAYFYKFYSARFPTLCERPFELSGRFPPPEIERAAAQESSYYHPERILEHYEVGSGKTTLHSQGILTFTYPLYGVVYANHLWEHDNVRVRNIFNGVAPGDGDFLASQTFTSLRTALLVMNTATRERDWQFASLAFEKEIGTWLSKENLIALGAGLGLPLEHTWSCYGSGLYQCGNKCLTCYYRQLAFRAARVPDKTAYSGGTLWGDIKTVIRLTMHSKKPMMKLQSEKDFLGCHT